MDDRELVARFLRARDEASFRALYRAHTPALLLLSQRMVGDTAAAEDAVQDAWMRAVRSLDGFRWESTLKTWLTAIAINCCREVLRGRRTRNTAEISDDHEELAVRPAILGADVEGLVQRLPDGYREVLVLHDVEGFTHDEVSERLGISAGTSRSQLFRARRTLRAWLDQPVSDQKKEG